LIKLLSICGSPVPESSTEYLLQQIAESVSATLAPTRVQHTLVALNSLEFIPCQACGESPALKWCFFDDGLTRVYKQLAAADCLLFGTPVYFDSVSAQAKMFIDRCNCFRPADFDGRYPDHDFVKRLNRKRPGATVLVGGKRGWFEGARRCVAGYFKWVEVVDEGLLTFHSDDFRCSKEAKNDTEITRQARELGERLGQLLKTTYAGS
jgi:multimeric flavodoxin WrbA